VGSTVLARLVRGLVALHRHRSPPTTGSTDRVKADLAELLPRLRAGGEVLRNPDQN
jgi:hypothetical protein